MKARHRLATRPGSRHGISPSLDSLLGAVRVHHPAADLAPVELAHEEAARWHAGQTRRSGDPYLTHCLAVSHIVADVGMPPTVVCAALQHALPGHPKRQHLTSPAASLPNNGGTAPFGDQARMVRRSVAHGRAGSKPSATRARGESSTPLARPIAPQRPSLGDQAT
ncbi:HD domain-containing protein [Streptomyces humi]|uniref:HD domain-containing protein n=1 Tax=Streptomyces humi TaxID=1428620 RepID=UPI0008FC2384